MTSGIIWYIIPDRKRGKKMANKVYDHTDHMVIMSELLVLYKLKNETEQKINVANEKNERMNKLLKEKEDIPF